MQNGFVNHDSRLVVSPVADLVARWSAAGRPVDFTRYFNYPDSPSERFFPWRRLQETPESDIVPELAEAAGHARAVVDKTGYTLFTPESAELIRRTGWTHLAFCEIATGSCVVKSAADAFERGYAPWTVTDSCASDAGPDVHDAGLLVAPRLIGTGQLVNIDHVMGQLATRVAAPVSVGCGGRSGPRRWRLAVFQVGSRAVHSGLNTSGDPAREAGDGEFWHQFGVMEVVAAELVCLQCDLLAMPRAQAAAVEEVEDLVTLAGVRCPVHDEQAADGGLDTEFLVDFAHAGSQG